MQLELKFCFEYIDKSNFAHKPTSRICLSKIPEGFLQFRNT